MAQTAELIRRLLGEFDDQGIAWCHWKSNDMLAASASGENDLDLLIARADATRCRGLLHELGFVEAVQRPSRRLPGVLDYHGNDPALGRPVHVHLHSRLVLGDDMTKNYHLPIEGPYLASVRRQGLFWVPAPELELLGFVIRMMLKHCAWDAVLMLQGRLSSSERRELRQLEANASMSELAALVEQLVPEVGAELFEECRAAVSGGAGPIQRIVLGLRLERALASFARRPLAMDVPLKTLRRIYWASRRVVAPRSRRKSLAHGGLVIAISGGRGAEERQRLIEQLDRWLSRDVAVLPLVYGASPRKTARRALRFAASGGLVLTADHPTGRDGPRTPGLPPPDLEIVLDEGGTRSVDESGSGVVLVAADGRDVAVQEAVRRAVWERL